MFYERSSSKYFRLQGPMFSFLAMLKSTIIPCIDNTYRRDCYNKTLFTQAGSGGWIWPARFTLLTPMKNYGVSKLQ